MFTFVIVRTSLINLFVPYDKKVGMVSTPKIHFIYVYYRGYVDVRVSLDLLHAAV